MNILMVHPHDLRHDPWTIRILALARELQQGGHSVQLFHLPRRELPSHSPLRELADDDPPCYDLKPRQQHVIHNFKLLYDRARDCDILHLQKCFAATALPMLWVSRLLHKPLHYDWDDNETAIAQGVEKRRLSRRQLAVYERYLPHFAQSMTCASRALQQRALQWGFPENRLWHLPVGADVNRFTPDKKCKDILSTWKLDPTQLTVLYIGQLEGASHAHLLIQAAPGVVAHYPGIQFLIVGGGEQEEGLRERVNQSPVKDAIRMTGYVEAALIPAIVGAADICVACFEDNDATRCKSPLKVTEYLAAGKAIVASRVGDVPWMIDGCGLCVPPGDPQAIADGILLYAKDPERRRLDGRLARQRALERFTWKQGARVLLDAYQAALYSGKK